VSSTLLSPHYYDLTSQVFAVCMSLRATDTCLNVQTPSGKR